MTAQDTNMATTASFTKLIVLIGITVVPFVAWAVLIAISLTIGGSWIGYVMC